MKILYGTGNQAKLSSMRRRLEGLNFEIIGLLDLEQEIPEVVETGTTPLENARLKAMAYYEAFHMPVFSCDSGMYLEGVPDEIQPGVHVRTIKGNYLTDEEVAAYYSGLAKQYGDLTAHYQNAICLIIDPAHIYECMDSSLESRRFIITSRRHEIREPGFPLDSLSVDPETGRYFYDLPDHHIDHVAVEDGFLEFFRKVQDHIAVGG